MKKIRILDLLSKRRWLKTWLVMRFVILFLLVSAMQVTAGVYSQEAKVTLQVENASFESVIRLLEKSTDYTFLYEDRHVECVQHLNLHYNGADIKEVLNACLKGTNLTYKLINRTIIIQRAAIVSADTLQKITVKGKRRNLAGGDDSGARNDFGFRDEC